MLCWLSVNDLLILFIYVHGVKRILEAYYSGADTGGGPGGEGHGTLFALTNDYFGHIWQLVMLI